MKERIRDLVDRHAGPEQVSETPIEGLRLFRVNHPIDRLPGIYPPSMCCIVQGRKLAYYGGEAHVYDTEHYLCAAIALPVEAEVSFATPDEPVLGIMLDLESRAMAETLVAYEAAAGSTNPISATEQAAGFVVGDVDDRFTTAIERLLELLDDPVAIRVLAESRLRELLFTIIEGEAGLLVRRTFGGTPDLTRVLTYLRANFNKPLSIDDLAARAGMSRAVFHRRFKEATNHSPMKFIKALRLSHAAMHIVRGEAVSQAADAVGYTSPSQFSREFRRQFGESPRQWAKSAAASAPDVQTTGA